MAHYRVFLGAPKLSDIDKDPSEYRWQSISSASSQDRLSLEGASLIYPAATLEAASRRISMLYQNIIFDNTEDEEAAPESQVLGSQPFSTSKDQTTIYSWPPSAEPPIASAPTFLHLSGSLPAQTQEATWETQGVDSLADYSNASSIARFPSFHFNLHKVVPIDTLKRSASHPTKVAVLLAVIEVEGPDTIRIKRGIEAGKEVSILKLVLGDEEGAICKLTSWRDVAEVWGGSGDAPGLKRGDVVYLENLTAACDPGASVMLTASPFNKPVLEICYRTMPYTHEDKCFRPDLRLGASDAVVRKVAALVDWFEDMAGLRHA